MRLKIRHKLFLTMFSTSIVVATGLYFYLQWSFDRGFLDYVKSQEKAQIGRLVIELTDYYAKAGNWDFLKENHRLWISIVSELDPTPNRLSLGSQRPAERRVPPNMAGPERFNTSGPPPSQSRSLGPRVILLDSQKNHVIGGPPERIGDLFNGGLDIQMFPILYEENTVGYIALMPLLELSYAGDLLFVEKQKESFTIVTLVMVLFSLILAYPLTRHLLRPINALTAGTNRLIAGVFKTRICVSSGDELGKLSDHFNILAMTLEKNEQARKQWVADISHELRTPLAILRGEVEAMQDGVRPMAPQSIDGLHGEIMHIERLVSDLYELSMSDIGALTYKKSIIDPVGILKGTLEMFEQRYLAGNMTLHTDIWEEKHFTMLGDPDRIQQLFTNLLENSLRYTKAPGTLEVVCTTDQERVRITFQDSGPGVSDEQLSKLFDRLYRVDSSRNRKRGGAGLGLAICKNIVEAHHGTIEAHHSKMAGLRIVIELSLHS